MKPVIFYLSKPIPGIVAAMAFFAVVAYGSPTFAASTQAQPSAIKVADRLATDNAGTESVETRIKGLHDKLQITPAQESQWKDVAQVMRENADTMTSLTKARFENAKNVTAIDDLKSYAKITEAHEKGIEKLLPVFTTLYDNLTDSQKKAADAEFRSHHSNNGHHGMS